MKYYKQIKPEVRDKLDDIGDNELYSATKGPVDSGKSGPRFTDEQRENRRAIVAERVLQGYSLAAIGRELGITARMVGYDLETIESRWRESSLIDFDEARSKELARLNKVEHEFWMAWERSKLPKNQTSQRTAPTRAGADDMRVSASMRTEERDGDPRFLDGVFKCIERRIRLYGLDQPEKIALAGVLDVNTDNDLTKRLSRYHDALSGGRIEVAAAIVAGNGFGQPVDSERPAPEASDILDVDRPDDG